MSYTSGTLRVDYNEVKNIYRRLVAGDIAENIRKEFKARRGFVDTVLAGEEILVHGRVYGQYTIRRYILGNGHLYSLAEALAIADFNEKTEGGMI